MEIQANEKKKQKMGDRHTEEDLEILETYIHGG